METGQLETVVQLVFMWIGFGTVVGLAAKAIMPGKDPGGSIATLIMGIIGTVIGCGLLKFFWPTIAVSPISVLGFCVGTGGDIHYSRQLQDPGRLLVHRGRANESSSFATAMASPSPP